MYVAKIVYRQELLPLSPRPAGPGSDGSPVAQIESAGTAGMIHSRPHFRHRDTVPGPLQQRCDPRRHAGATDA